MDAKKRNRMNTALSGGAAKATGRKSRSGTYLSLIDDIVGDQLLALENAGVASGLLHVDVVVVSHHHLPLLLLLLISTRSHRHYWHRPQGTERGTTGTVRGAPAGLVIARTSRNLRPRPPSDRPGAADTRRSASLPAAPPRAATLAAACSRPRARIDRIIAVVRNHSGPNLPGPTIPPRAVPISSRGWSPGHLDHPLHRSGCRSHRASPTDSKIKLLRKIS